ERRLAERVKLIGVSLALNAPRVGGPLAGYPHDEAAVERLLASRIRRLFQVAPGRLRERMLAGVPREQTASVVYGGMPSVAHTEALLRGTVLKGIELSEPVDALVIGVPPTTPFMPRERPNPISAAYLALGLALRLWRNRPPIGAGGTAIILHPFPRRFPRPTQTPYRALFADLRTAGDPDAMHDAERNSARNPRALDEYRAGRACHPLQPFVEWSACDASAHRLGAVLIAGCRDAQAARQLGYVPVHGLGAAPAPPPPVSRADPGRRDRPGRDARARRTRVAHPGRARDGLDGGLEARPGALAPLQPRRGHDSGSRCARPRSQRAPAARPGG